MVRAGSSIQRAGTQYTSMRGNTYGHNLAIFVYSPFPSFVRLSHILLAAQLAREVWHPKFPEASLLAALFC